MSTLKKENDSLDLQDKVSAVAGGTGGIGSGIAIRLAQLGSSVYVIGRNEELGSAVVAEMKKVAKGGSEGKTYEFIKGDLSTVSGMKSIVSTLESRSKTTGIDFLFQAQGGPPNGLWNTTSDGHEFHFAVQILSRFTLQYLLAKSGTLRNSVVNVCAAGSGVTDLDVDDLELKAEKDSWRASLIYKIAQRDSAVIDALTLEFNERFPKLKAIHLFPGYVTSDAAKNQGFPFPIPQMSSLFKPIANLMGCSPQRYADTPIFLAVNPKGRESNVSFATGSWKKVEASPWASNADHRKKAWETIRKLVED